MNFYEFLLGTGPTLKAKAIYQAKAAVEVSVAEDKIKLISDSSGPTTNLVIAKEVENQTPGANTPKAITASRDGNTDKATRTYKKV